MRYLWIIILTIIILWYLFKRLLFPTKTVNHFDISKSPFRELEVSQNDHLAIISIMKRLDRLMKENNVEYFLIAGSLMGALRYNNRMPWDDDIDIGILSRQSFESLPFSKYDLAIRKVWFGYKVFDVNNNRRVLLESTFPFIDVFMFIKTGDSVSYESDKARKTWPRESIKLEYLYPLGICNYAGMSIPCPGKSDKFLTQAFPGWDTTAYIGGSHTGKPLFRNYKMPINSITSSEVQEYLKLLSKKK